MLPEHLLLAGIVVLIGLEIVAGAAARGARRVASAPWRAAAVAASGSARQRLRGDAVPRAVSVDPGRLARQGDRAGARAARAADVARRFRARRTFHILLLSSLYGFCLLLSADSFLTLFLGIEIMSLPVYVLVLLAFQRPESAEAALKYLVLGGTATAMFLMGASLLYGASGSLALVGVRRPRCGRADTMATAGGGADPGRVLPQGGDRAVPRVGAGRLRGREPSGHRVHGDDHQGRRAAGRACACSAPRTCRAPIVDLVALLPLVSIVWGNLAAMRQTSFRRMIAYSSIAHAGLPVLRVPGRRRRPLPGDRVLRARLRPDEPPRVRVAARAATTTRRATGWTT